MKEWHGSAAICFNENNEVLMVRSNDSIGWSVPSGGIEIGETPEECCIREVKEETGYEVRIIESLFVKESVIKGINVNTHYFKVEKIGESVGINDPDKTIIEAAWKTLLELVNLIHMYPEDLEIIQRVLKMKFKVYENAHDFEKKIESFLLEKEDVFSLFYGVLQAIKAGNYENPFMATIEEDGNVLAFFQMTPPHPLNIIFVDENRLDEIIDFFIKNIVELKIEFSSIISLKEWAYKVAEKWEDKTGKAHQLLMDQGLYRLNTVNEMLVHSPGSWRYAEESDSALIEKWFNSFENDAGLSTSPIEQVKKRVAMFLNKQEIFIWEDKGKIVSMMKKSRPTKNGVTVSLVFTPKEERKKGYARTLVTAVSKELLKDFNFCVLYTDLMNPTSNKIYREIGYERIADSVHLGFDKGE
ncbi:GNAT family N-acetyltransferase [Bacillus sp. RO2]|nr:GNAT family N-acetyltransferase [Bacillus sp. RO2]